VIKRKKLAQGRETVGAILGGVDDQDKVTREINDCEKLKGQKYSES